jgi:hypothetical protein
MTEQLRKTGCLMVAILALAIAPMTGCAILGGGDSEPTPLEQIQAVEPWVEEAAFWGTLLYLQDNPGHRPGFIAAIAAIDAVSGEEIDYDMLTQILGDLGGEEGDIAISAAIQSAINLLASYQGQFDLIGSEEEALAAKRLLVRVRNGMTRAVNLGEPKTMKKAKVPKK